MNALSKALVSVSAAAFVFTSSVVAQDKPMHMHKSEMDHSRKDSEVAAEYRSEATQLREKAESHRKLAQMYKTRTAPKGGASYTSVAKHCEQLAKSYEDAAKAAEAVSTELSKTP